MNRYCIVIPVYNNHETIYDVVFKCLELNQFVIVVDDGSDIMVDSILGLHHSLTILRHNINRGKGKAIITGAKEAKRLGFEYIVTIDGDGQHYPCEFFKLLPVMEDNTIVIGCREFEENVPNSSKFGRVFSNFWIFLETGVWLDDTQSGFRAYPISILELDLTHSRYDFEIEVIVKHIWAQRDVKEAKIRVYYPPSDKRVSHFDKLRDNIRLSKIHSKLVLINVLRKLKLISHADH